MRWIYDAELMNYLENGWYVVKFAYNRGVQWAEGTQLAQEATTRRELAGKNGILDEIYSLAERYAPLSSPGANLV